MATSDEKEKTLEKLKELEVSLAKELDQKVRLTEPSDPRLEGQLQVNPNLMESALAAAKAKLEKAAANAQVATPNIAQAPGTPSPTAGLEQDEPKPKDKDVDDISLEEVDDLLNTLDEGFKNTMDEIKNEISKIEPPPVHLESLSIGADYLKEAESKTDEAETDPLAPVAVVPEEFEDEDPPGAQTLLTLLGVALKTTMLLPFRVGKIIVSQLKLLRSSPPKEIFFALLEFVKSPLRDWLSSWKALIEKFLGILQRPILYLHLLWWLLER